MSGEDRDTAIRAALRRHRLKAGGFVAGSMSTTRSAAASWLAGQRIVTSLATIVSRTSISAGKTPT